MHYGCNAFESIGDSKSEEACKYEVSKALDKQDYDRAEELLNGECADAFSEPERYMNLGAVYLGRAGYSLPSLISDIVESNSESTGTEDSFSNFIKRLATKGGGEKVLLIEKARDYYEEALKALGEDLNCDNPQTRLEKDICFFKGIADISQATSSFVTLFETVTGGEEDIQKIVEESIKVWAESDSQDTQERLDCSIDADQDKVVDGAQFTACALEYATEYAKATPPIDIPIGENSKCKLEKAWEGDFGYNGKWFKVVKLSVKVNSDCADTYGD